MNEPLVLISTGEYSCYEVIGIFTKLREFDVPDVMAEFVAQWKPPSEWRDYPEVCEFVAYLNANGYIADLEAKEIHLNGGGYGSLWYEPRGDIRGRWQP